MRKILLGFTFCSILCLASPKFYMKQDSHGFACAMERHFPRDRVVYCSADAGSVLQLVQGLNIHGYSTPPSPPQPKEEDPVAK